MKIARRQHVDRFSEEDREASERQMKRFRLYLRGYVAMRVDEVAASFWRK